MSEFWSGDDRSSGRPLTRSTVEPFRSPSDGEEKCYVDGITFDTGRLFPKTVEVWGGAEHRHDRQIGGLGPDRESIERLGSC